MMKVGVLFNKDKIICLVDLEGVDDEKVISLQFKAIEAGYAFFPWWGVEKIDKVINALEEIKRKALDGK